MKLLVLFCLAQFLPAQADTVDWEKDALRLSGESDRVLRSSIKHLLSIPNLNEKLVAALEEKNRRRFLALDVISTLKRSELLPAIIAASEKDESGFFYLAINTFIDPAHANQISTLYLKRLDDRHTASAAKLVLLDTLARLRSRVPDKTLKNLLQDEHDPEMRSAAVLYLRTFWLKTPGARVCADCLTLLRKDDPEAIALLSELSQRRTQ